MYARAFRSGWEGAPVNAQTSGRPVKGQWSLIYYLTLRGKIAATAMDKELNTRQDVLLVQLGRTKLQLTGYF